MEGSKKNAGGGELCGGARGREREVDGGELSRGPRIGELRAREAGGVDLSEGGRSTEGWGPWEIDGYRAESIVIFDERRSGDD